MMVGFVRAIGGSRLPAFLLLGLALATLCRAQTVEVARVVDATGRWSTNGAYVTVAAVGQPGPAGWSTNLAHINWSGFLNGFLMFPALDVDRDGIVDENDPDDDNDGLADAVEIGGQSFDPPTFTDSLLADTDGDGMTDGGEAAAGSNPLDANSLLTITRFGRSANGVVVTWQSREGRAYDLLTAGSVASIASNAVVVTNATAAGGTGVWHAAETSGTDTTGRTNAVYRVRISVP
jgi:hypothetical protein